MKRKAKTRQRLISALTLLALTGLTGCEDKEVAQNPNLKFTLLQNKIEKTVAADDQNEIAAIAKQLCVTPTSTGTQAQSTAALSTAGNSKDKTLDLLKNRMATLGYDQFTLKLEITDPGKGGEVTTAIDIDVFAGLHSLACQTTTNMN